MWCVCGGCSGDEGAPDGAKKIDPSASAASFLRCASGANGEQRICCCFPLPTSCSVHSAAVSDTATVGAAAVGAAAEGAGGTSMHGRRIRMSAPSHSPAPCTVSFRSSCVPAASVSSASPDKVRQSVNS